MHSYYLKVQFTSEFSGKTANFLRERAQCTSYMHRTVSDASNIKKSQLKLASVTENQSRINVNVVNHYLRLVKSCQWIKILDSREAGTQGVRDSF